MMFKTNAVPFWFRVLLLQLCLLIIAANPSLAKDLNPPELVFHDICQGPDELNDIRGAHDFKPWTLSEKRAVSRVFSSLPKTFIANATESAGGKIIFVRATKKDNQAYASAKFNTVCIYDSTFDQAKNLGDTYLKRVVAHELTHTIDFAQRYSYSSEWLSLMHPKLNKLRLKIATIESGWEQLRETLRQGFAQAPVDYAEIMCCLSSCLVIGDDFIEIPPDVKRYLQKIALDRKPLTALDRRKRELWHQVALLQPVSRPNHPANANPRAIVKLLKENDTKDWFYPIDTARGTGQFDTHDDADTLKTTLTELNRLNALGLNDEDPLKNDVLLSAARLDCRLGKLADARIYFQKACPDNAKLVKAFDDITPWEHYNATIVLARMLFDRAPDLIKDYAAEPNSLVQAGDLNEVVKSIDKMRLYLGKTNRDAEGGNSLLAEKACLLYDMGKFAAAKTAITEVKDFDLKKNHKYSWFVTVLTPSLLAPGETTKPIICPTGEAYIFRRGGHFPIGSLRLSSSNGGQKFKGELHWDDYASVPISDGVATTDGEINGSRVGNTLVLGGAGYTFHRLKIVSPTCLEFIPSREHVEIRFSNQTHIGQ